MWRFLKSACERWGNNHAITLACQHGSNIDTINGVGIINDHALDRTGIFVENCIESSITCCRRNFMRHLNKNFLEPECCISTTKKVDLWLLTVDDTSHCGKSKLRILRGTTNIVHIKMIWRLKCRPPAINCPVSIARVHHEGPFQIIPTSHAIVAPTCVYGSSNHLVLSVGDQDSA